MARVHRVEQHHTSVSGVEAITFASTHHFPRHAHDQFGVGVIAFGGHRSWSGVGQVAAGAGDVIMCNPGEMHDGMPVDGGPRGWRMIYLDPALVSAELREEGGVAAEMVRPVARDPRLARHFARAFACLTSSRPDLLAREESLLLTLIHMMRQHGTLRPPSSRRLPCVVKALRRLDAAPAAPVSLVELAALAGVSRFQLLRGFKRQVGITPHAYLVQRRVRLARQLLASGQTPIQAAIGAGFADQSHMTRAFVRQLGITPGRYRAAVA